MSENTQTAPRPTNLVDLLDQLVLPTEPAPVSMIPQTSGWVVLALLVMAGVAYGLWHWHLLRQRNAYRAVALNALETAGSDPAAIAQILRRCALAAYPRTRVAALTGEDWLTFLDRSVGGQDFRSGAGRALIAAPYQPKAAANPVLLELARDWVRGHKHEIGP
ncbi:MAG: DUF4381 domain-containing protein [Pseudomonadota bacterium]